MYISAEGNDWIPAGRKKRNSCIRSQATIDKIKALGFIEVCIDVPDAEISEDNSQNALPAEEVKTSSEQTRIESGSDKSSFDGVEPQSSNAEEFTNPAEETSSEKETEDIAAGEQTGLINQYQALSDEEKKPTDTDSKTTQFQDKETKEGLAQRAKKHIPGAILVPFDIEFKKAKKLHGKIKEKVKESMDQAKIGKPIDVDGIEELADGLIDSIISNQNTLSMMTAFKNQGNYLYEHSVNCSILMGIFARHLKMSFEMIHDLVTGAMLHDIGMTQVPEEILLKSGTLTPGEQKEMQRHIIIGRKMLEKNHGVPAIAMEVCKQHHEMLDGQGYPQKIHSHQVNKYGRIGAVVDIYDALTSDRSYRKAFSPSSAMKKMLGMRGSHLDGKLLSQFIQCINVFPVGSLVELDDSRIAVVYELNSFKKYQPKVKVFYSGKNDCQIKPEIIDLADSNMRVKIKKPVDNARFDVNLDNVI